MPGGVGWTVDRPTKQRQGRSDTTLFMICRAMFGGEESFRPEWEESLMQNLAWYQGESLKRLLQGAALGAFATLASDSAGAG